jgi:hypothetical protein
MTLAALVLACVAHQPVATRQIEPPDPPYAKVHRRETRELRLYESFDTELVLRATLVTDEVRQSGAAELAYRGAMTRAEADAFVARAQTQGAGTWEVVFASMRAHDDARDFGIGDGDPWRVRLQVNGTACTPVAVERIGEPTVAQRVLYPQTNEWSDLWAARFEDTCGRSGTVTFSVAGPRASGEVHWRDERRD